MPDSTRDSYYIARVHDMLNAELEPEPVDVTRLKQAAEEGNADAQGVYARLLARDDAGILAAVPWYCKAMQAGK